MIQIQEEKRDTGIKELREGLLSVNLMHRMREVDLEHAVKMAGLLVSTWYLAVKNHGPLYTQQEMGIYLRMGHATVFLMRARSNAEFQRLWDKHWEWH